MKNLSPELVARITLQRQSPERIKVFDCLIEKGYAFIGEGRHRIVFRSPNGRWVVKLARDADGDGANDVESINWKNRNNNQYLPLARCKRLSPSLLVMEYVEYIDHSNMPRWANSIDCRQVGRNRAGNIVAYDYGG